MLHKCTEKLLIRPLHFTIPSSGSTLHRFRKLGNLSAVSWLFKLHICLQHVTQAVRTSEQKGRKRKRGQGIESQISLSVRLLRTLRYIRSIPFEHLENWDIRQPFRQNYRLFYRMCNAYVVTLRFRLAERYVQNTRRRYAILLLHSEATIKVNNYIFVPADFYEC
jgi:hypothetical protein